MANFTVDVGADNDEVVSTLNYLLSNLGSTPYGLTINQVNGEILNIGTNTVVGYLYQYINIAWARNKQGLYYTTTSTPGQVYYGISNTNTATYPNAATAFTWKNIGGYVASGNSYVFQNGAIGVSPYTYLWYSVQGGRQITFTFADTAPSAGFVKYTGGVIDLDVITFVGNSSIIGNNTVIGNYATIGTNANIGDYWTAGKFGNIGSNLIVAANATIGNKLTIGTDAVIGTSANIGSNATIASNLSIGANLYATGLITNSVLDANTVGTTQVVNLSITNGKLAANAVTTDKIQDYTIVGTDLANATIGSQQITNYSITGTDIANATVTSDKLSVSALSDITANAGNITTGQITGLGRGGSTIIAGYTTGTVISLSNIALTNAAATSVGSYTVSAPAGNVRLMISVTGTVNHWGNETTNGVYDAMSGNILLEMLYSNTTPRLSSLNFSQGGVTMVRRSATSYDYRFYVPYANDQTQLCANDTYTFELTPNWFYRNNGTGNLVTPTTPTITFQGRIAIFQANIT